MQRFVRSWFAVCGIVGLAAVLVACPGPDENGEGPVINFQEPECDTTQDCEDGEECIERECVPVEEPQGCETSDDCPFTSQECIDNRCVFPARQCGEVGEECEPGELTAQGFACEDLGRGHRCYETCRGVRACIDGQPGEQMSCNRRERCVLPADQDFHGYDVDMPVCQPSECEDYFDTDEGCEMLQEHDPDALAGGSHCEEVDEGTFVCVGAGTGQSGDACERTSDCADGLSCVNRLPQQGLGVAGWPEMPTAPPVWGTAGEDSFCAPVCQGDEDCGDGLECIGQEAGPADGEGFCGDRCDAFAGDEQQCDEDTACVPVSTEDGACVRDATGERDFYEACESTEQCPDSAHCVGQILEQGSFCYPLCDPTLDELDDRHATCPQPTTEAFVQIAHFASEQTGTLEVVVDGVVEATVAPGDVERGEDGFLRLEMGERQVELREEDTEQVIYETTAELDRNDAAVWAIADSDAADGIRLLSHQLPRDVEVDAGESLVRFVHAFTGGEAVDVIAAVPEEITPEPGDNGDNDNGDNDNGDNDNGDNDNGDNDNGDQGGDEPEVSYGESFMLVEDLSYGDASDFVEWPETDDELDLLVVPADEEELDEAYLVYEDADPTEDAAYSAYAIGSTDGTFEGGIHFAEYASAQLGRQLGGNCVELYGAFGLPLSPEIGSGICLEGCTSSDDFGKDACSADGYGCTTGGTCESLGDSGPGQACSSDSHCQEGLHCDETGDGGGTCRSLCQPDEQTNDSLGCADGEICVPDDDSVENLGRCRLPCEPGDDSIDTSCPDFQQTCLTAGEQSYCFSSGNIAHGNTCDDQTVQDCEPGMVCAKRRHDLVGVLLEPFSDISEDDRIDAEPTCRQICEPFTGDFAESGCPDGFACSPAMPDGPSRVQGHCVPATEPAIEPLQPCPSDEVGSMCGDNSYCILDGENECVEDQPGLCLQFCDYPRQAGCTDGTVCQEGFIGGPLLGFLGLCLTDTD